MAPASDGDPPALGPARRRPAPAVVSPVHVVTAPAPARTAPRRRVRLAWWCGLSWFDEHQRGVAWSDLLHGWRGGRPEAFFLGAAGALDRHLQRRRRLSFLLAAASLAAPVLSSAQLHGHGPGWAATVALLFLALGTGAAGLLIAFRSRPGGLAPWGWGLRRYYARPTRDLDAAVLAHPALARALGAQRLVEHCLLPAAAEIFWTLAPEFSGSIAELIEVAGTIDTQRSGAPSSPGVR